MKRKALILLFIGWYFHLSWGQVAGVTFRHLYFKDGLPDHAEPFALIQDHQSRLWFGTDKGLFVYDGAEISTVTPNIQDSAALPEMAVQALYLHEDSTIWMGTRNLGICIYYPYEDRFQRFLPIGDGGRFPVKRVRDFFKDDKGLVWISSDEGLVRCDPSDMSFRLYQYRTAGMSDTEFEYLNTLREVSNDPYDEDKLWICTRQGLLSFQKSRAQFTRHPMPFSSAEIGLSEIDYMLIDMEWTSPHDVWFTAWGSGILHYNTRTQEWKQFRNPEADPLYDIIYTILPKDDDEFWFAGYGFAGVFNHETGTYNFFPQDRERGGLLSNMLYCGVVTAHDGALVIGGSGGINISNEIIAQQTQSVYPILTDIEIDGQSIPVTLDGNTLHVDNKDHSLRFTTSMPVYHAYRQAKFRFRLLGYDHEWHDNGISGTIQYTNLRPGSYQLHYASGIDNSWMEGGTPVTIMVQRPLYQHWWFIMVCVIFLSGILGMFYSVRIRQIRRELRLKSEFDKRLAENEMTALRAQMNPHFMFNSLNSIKNFILKENTGEASRYLTRFSQLMRAILKNSQYRLVSLEDELSALRLYIEMESMRFNHEFECVINVDESIRSNEAYIPPLLIQPYVENAIWHGLRRKEGPRKLFIEIAQVSDQIIINIEDNGIGRAAAKANKLSENGASKSFGMKITKDRIDLINRTLGIDAYVAVDDIYTDDGIAGGTRVKIHLPMLNEDGLSIRQEEANV